MSLYGYFSASGAWDDGPEGACLRRGLLCRGLCVIEGEPGGVRCPNSTSVVRWLPWLMNGQRRARTVDLRMSSEA